MRLVLFSMGFALLPGPRLSVTPPVPVPPTGAPITLSPSGEIWRIPGVHVAVDFKNQILLAVWHDSVVFDTPHGHPVAHNFLNASRIQTRAVRLKPDGSMTLGPVLAIGPVTTNFAASGPRVVYNPNQNEFLVVWSEGIWTAGDDAVTDLNADGKPEYVHVQEPFPATNNRIVARRIAVTPLNLAVTIVGSQFEVSMGTTGASPVAPSGTDPIAIHPALLPDVSCDGSRYVFVWQTLEKPVTGLIEGISNSYQLRHVFRTESRSRYRLFTATGTPLTGFTDLSNATYRLFVKGPPSTSSNVVDGSIAANLQNENVYDSVPTDPMPRTASLILPGPDGVPGTADDIPVGTLMVWSVTSLVFNKPKSRIRARFLPPGATTAGIVWDIFSGFDQIVQRAQVAAGPSKDSDDPATPENETRLLSHFLVAFQTVEDVVWEGSRAVEYVGSIRARMAEETGLPSGAIIDIATADPGQMFLSPTVVWGYETEQYFLSWTRTDTSIWNPYTYGRSWYPKGWSLLDTTSNGPPGALLANVASVYPAVASVSYSGLVVPGNPYGVGGRHAIYAGQEDDFGANFAGWYKFTDPGTVLGNPTISVGSNNIAFSVPEQSTSTSSKSLTLSNGSSGDSVLQWEAKADAAWLTVGPSSGQLTGGQSTTLTLTVDPAGLAGAKTANLMITSPTAVNSPVEVSVTLQIGGAALADVGENSRTKKKGGCGGSLSATPAGHGTFWIIAALGLTMLGLAGGRRARNSFGRFP